MIAPDFTYYSTKYRGTANEVAFDSYLVKALAHVKWLVGFNEVNKSNCDVFKRAVCACVDVLVEHGGMGGGFSIGSFSVSGEGSDVLRKELSDAATKELFGTTLLYQGVR